MDENIVSRDRFWIVRFKDKTGGYDAYVVDTSYGSSRRTWWHSKDIDDAYHFSSRAEANKALKSPVWKDQGFTRVSEYATEVVEIRETLTETREELQVISNENALVQLARLAEANEQDNSDNEDRELPTSALLPPVQ